MQHGEVRVYRNPDLPFLSIEGKIRFILPSNLQIYMCDFSVGGYHAKERYSLISPAVLGVWDVDR